MKANEKPRDSLALFCTHYCSGGVPKRVAARHLPGGYGLHPDPTVASVGMLRASCVHIVRNASNFREFTFAPLLPAKPTKGSPGVELPLSHFPDRQDSISAHSCGREHWRSPPTARSDVPNRLNSSAKGEIRCAELFALQGVLSTFCSAWRSLAYTAHTTGFALPPAAR
jgi:hypothetical protein